MKCPNCGLDMSKKGYCMHCGYMDNGVIIDTKKKVQAPDLELYFGDDWDKISRNNNWFISGVLGPTYLFCRNHYLVGLLLIIVDTLVSLFVITINYAMMASVLNKFYWLINRIFWATMNNIIYINLTKKRLIKYREKHSDNADINIQELYKKDSRLLVLKYICFGLVFLIIYWFFQNILNYYASLA